MTTTLDRAKTLALLDNAVEDRGFDYVYPSDQKDSNERGDYFSVCRYVFRGPRGGLKGPGCIIGHVLAQVGVPTKFMAPYDVAGNGKTTPGVTLLRLASDAGYITYDEDAEHILELAQSIQDNGTSWGDAVASVKNEDD